MQPTPIAPSQLEHPEDQMAVVKEIVAESCGISPDEIDENKTLLVDLPWDSLDQVECVMELEEHFCISISDEMMAEAKTVRDIANGIESLLSKQKE